MRGSVKFYNTAKGFGFVQRSDGFGDVFFHVSELACAGVTSVAEGDILEFAIGESRGRPCAINIKFVARGARVVHTGGAI